MLNTKITIAVLVSVILGGFGSPGVCIGQGQHRVIMSLDASVSKISKMNPILTELESDQSDRIRTIKGPVNFKFLYGKMKPLVFSNTKLVIYKTSNARIKYIHIFPQQKNLNKDKLFTFIKKIEQQLVSAGWKKRPTSLSKKSTVLQNAGIKDYAHYRLETLDESGQMNHYEVAFTTFVDASIHCVADQESSSKHSKCENRFIRLGFNKV